MMAPARAVAASPRDKRHATLMMKNREIFRAMLRLHSGYPSRPRFNPTDPVRSRAIVPIRFAEYYDFPGVFEQIPTCEMTWSPGVGGVGYRAGEFPT